MQLLLYACEMLGVEQVPSYKCHEATGQRKALSREACWTSEYSKVLQHQSSLQLSALTEVLSIQTQRQYTAAIFNLLAPCTTDVRIPCS